MQHINSFGKDFAAIPGPGATALSLTTLPPGVLCVTLQSAFDVAQPRYKSKEVIVHSWDVETTGATSNGGAMIQTSVVSRQIGSSVTKVAPC